MIRTEQEIEEVFAATYDADPDHEDEDIERVQNVLRWVLGHDDSSPQDFIRDYISD